jgi:hypothetical protein
VAHIADILRLVENPAIRKEINESLGVLRIMGKTFVVAAEFDKDGIDVFDNQRVSTFRSSIEDGLYRDVVDCYEPVRVSYFCVGMEEDDSEKARSMSRELWKQGIYCTRINHFPEDKDSSGKNVQALLVVPHERLAYSSVLKKIILVDNLLQIDKFVLYLAEKGLIDLNAQEEEIQNAYGLRALFYAQRYLGEHKVTAPSPAV